MSVIKVNSIQHSGAANASIELNANGRVAFSNTVAFTSNNVTIGGQALSPVTGMRNRIINGDMRIDQRNAGSAVTLAASGYTVDRWRLGLNVASKVSAQQVSDAPDGFVSSLKFTTVSAYSITANDIISPSQLIEGFNCADFMWGSSSAKTVTLSFWVKSSLTGSFGGAFSVNTTPTASWNPFNYTINSANTWEFKTITITGPTYGPLQYTDNNAGIQIHWSLGVGSTFTSTPGVWGTTQYRNAIGTVNLVETLNATLQITGVQLEVGSVATPFERRPYGLELALCQRYYEDSGNAAYNVVGPYTYSTNQLIRVPVLYKVTKRSSCTLTINDDNGNANRIYRNGTNRTFSIWLNTPYVFSIANTDTPSGSTDDIAFRWTASAEL